MNGQVSINVQKIARFLDVIHEWPSFKIRHQKIGRFFLDAYDVGYKIVSIVVIKNRQIFCTRFLKRPSFQKKYAPDIWGYERGSRMAKYSNLVKKNCPIFWTFKPRARQKIIARFFGRGSRMAKFQAWFANIKEFKQSIQ